jgi:hypothetical protein
MMAPYRVDKFLSKLNIFVKFKMTQKLFFSIMKQPSLQNRRLNNNERVKKDLFFSVFDVIADATPLMERNGAIYPFVRVDSDSSYTYLGSLGSATAG